jgi:hypothetical protein
VAKGAGHVVIAQSGRVGTPILAGTRLWPGTPPNRADNEIHIGWSGDLDSRPYEEAVAPLGARRVVGSCREEAPYSLSFFEPDLRF